MSTLFRLAVVALLAPASAALAGRQATLLFTGDNRAEVAPCGCRNKPTGGLARRLGVVQSFKGAALVLDAGNALFKTSSPATAEEKKRAAFVMKTMGRVGTRAMAVGERDLSAGADFLAAEAKAAGVSLLSANLTLGGKRPFEPSKIFTVNGVKVALIGVSGGSVAPLEAKSALEAVLAELEALGPRDLTVVVAALPRFDAVELAERLYGKVDAVVQSSDGLGVEQPAQKLQSGTYLLGAGQLGEGFGKLTFSLEGAGPFVDKNEMTTEKAYVLYLDLQVTQLEERIARTSEPAARKEAARELATLKARRDEFKKALPATAPAGARTFSFDWVMLGTEAKDDPAIKAEALTFEPTYTGNR